MLDQYHQIRKLLVCMLAAEETMDFCVIVGYGSYSGMDKEDSI